MSNGNNVFVFEHHCDLLCVFVSVSVPIRMVRFPLPIIRFCDPIHPHYFVNIYNFTIQCAEFHSFHCVPQWQSFLVSSTIFLSYFLHIFLPSVFFTPLTACVAQLSTVHFNSLYVTVSLLQNPPQGIYIIIIGKAFLFVVHVRQAKYYHINVKV